MYWQLAVALETMACPVSLSPKHFPPHARSSPQTISTSPPPGLRGSHAAHALEEGASLPAKLRASAELRGAHRWSQLGHCGGGNPSGSQEPENSCCRTLPGTTWDDTSERPLVGCLPECPFHRAPSADLRRPGHYGSTTALVRAVGLWVSWSGAGARNATARRLAPR